MAAFTEGFQDTTGGKSHLGSLISKAIAARRFAEDERKLAEEKAKKAGYDSLEEIGVEKGYFFKAALKSKFGGSYLTGKKQDIKAAVDRVKLLKNPKSQFWNFVDNRDSEGKEVKKLNEVERFRKQFDNYAFVSAKRPPEKEVKAETEVVPKKMSPFQLEQSRKAKTEEAMLAKTEAKIAKAASGGGGGRVTREDILTAVTAIASSLEKTAQSINNTIGETKVIADGVQAIRTDVVTQLSERTDSIENKLDAIVAAINAQTDLQKKQVDQAEDSGKISEQKQQGKAADSGDFDDLMTAEDESADDKLGSELNLGDPSPAATSAQDIEFQQQDMYRKPPEAETGGIISGPDEGYLAKLHGDEMVIPLDNNYTQGQPSAMDGKVRPVPETPAIPKKSYETGTPAQPSSLGSKVGFTQLDLGMGSKSSSKSDSLAQPLMDAMSLPMMVAGGTILSSVSNLINQLGPENADVSGEIAQIARPIAQVFGLPNNLVNKATRNSGGGESSRETQDESKNEKKKNFFSNLFDKLKNIATGNNSNNSGGGGGPSTPLSSDASGDMNTGAEMLVSAGVPERGAAMLAGNIQQESSWQGQRDWGQVMGDGTSRNGGLVSWASWSDDPARLGKIEKYLGKPITEATDSEQIGAMLWEMEKDYPAAYKVFMDPNATTAELKKASKQYWGYGHEGARFAYAEQALKHLQEGEQLLQAEEQNPDLKPEPTASPLDASKMKQTFGLSAGESFDFNVPGKGHYKAVRTSNGFEIFKYGGLKALIGQSTRQDTSNGANAWLVKAMVAEGKRRVTAAAQITPPSNNGSTQPEQASLRQEALRPVEKTRRSATSSVEIASLNSGGRSTETSSKPDAESAVVPEGTDNGLTDLLNPNPVTST